MSVFKSSVRMEVLICLLLSVLHVTKGCVLEKWDTTDSITAHTGGPVLLPCYCTHLHSKPETFTWNKYDGNRWMEISTKSDQYRNRVQLFNDSSPGNLSLLISHLTEEDGGDYRCNVKDFGYTYVRLTVKGCALKNRRQALTITAHTGGSVLLLCSCTDLQTKPKTFTWKKHNTNTKIWDKILIHSDQLVNDHSPGNLSLLISHLTEEDGGWYRCVLKHDEYTDINLVVEGDPKVTESSIPVFKMKPLTTVPQQNGQYSSPTPNSPPELHLFIYGGVGGLLLLMVLGVVIYWRYKARRQKRVESAQSKKEQRRDQQTQDCSEVLYCTIPSEHADKPEQKQNDSEVLYACINPQSKRKSAQKDDVTYSTIDHSRASTPAHTITESGDVTEYATIKLN